MSCCLHLCVCVFSTHVCGTLWRVKTHSPCSTCYPERQRRVEDRQTDEWMPSVSSAWCRWTWPLLPIMPHCWMCWWRPEQNTTPTVSDTHTLQSHYTIHHNMNLNNYVLWINVITTIFIDNFILNHNHIFRIHKKKIQCHTMADFILLLKKLMNYLINCKFKTFLNKLYLIIIC